MTSTLSAYLPQDRRYALFYNTSLPQHTSGAALFADISGFTSLSKKLTGQLGDRRGIEELTSRINSVYEALIRLVELYQGSVISFAGDAITCWFDASEGKPSRRATSAALAMQAAMHTFKDISLKVAVTTGPACRFVVGDPQVQLLDTLAGQTIARLARAEQLARQGEVLIDKATLETVKEEVKEEVTLQIEDWRYDDESGEPFAHISISTGSLSIPLKQKNTVELASERVRQWVLPNVYARELGNLGEFLTELRPAAVLFLRFSGLDYDRDPQAQQKLDALVQHVQRIVGGFEGSLLQLTIGDKGSYLYACFGAPIAHEDDARRAVSAALALRDLPLTLTFLQPVQIGISRGISRVGAYGGTTRRTYGVLGDEVNLAARLMGKARPGEILITNHLQTLLADRFVLESRLPVTVKGHSEAVKVFGVTEETPQRSTRLLEPAYRHAMIGRQAELALISSRMELARQGKGQIIGITGEAGLGKSRLVAEVIGLGQRQGFKGYGGACQSSGTNSPYLAWKAIWQAFFEIEHDTESEIQVSKLESRLAALAPRRLPALPLLGPLLDTPLEENDFSRTLQPKDRRNVLTALLEECLKAAAQEEPVLVVLEDVHWIDPLSHDLLLALGKTIANSAVCFVLAYRPVDLERLQAPQVEALPYFIHLELSSLEPAEAEQLIRARAAQLFPEEKGELPGTLLKELASKGQGNPFFLEELLNYLRDREISPYDGRALQALDLPASLHTLILSRIDQLSERQKATLKVASIIGRLFAFNWLQGYYPTLGTVEAVKNDLHELARLDITPLDTPEPELSYLFKHIVTQEVAYLSLASATRADLHERLAGWLEGQDPERYLDLLAYHYGRSENRAKQREYFEKAGDAARIAYSNEAALDYYDRLLPLLREQGEQAELYLSMGAVLELIGRREEAERRYREALALSGKDLARKARAQLALGKLNRLLGNFPEALVWLEQARIGWETLDDRGSLSQVLIESGVVEQMKGEFEAAWTYLEEGLDLAREVNDKRSISLALNVLGNVIKNKGDHQAARVFHEESLSVRREMGDRWGIGASLANLGNLFLLEGRNLESRALFEESLIIFREIGDKENCAALLNNLGNVHYNQGDYYEALILYQECLTLAREIGNKWGIALELHNLGNVFFYLGDYPKAQTLHEEALLLRQEMRDRQHIGESLHSMGVLALYQGDTDLARTRFEESYSVAREIGNKRGMVATLIGLAAVLHRQNQSQSTAHLAGAVENWRANFKFALERGELKMYQETVDSARQVLGDNNFQAAFEAGQKLTLEEAMQLALEKE
ncbi:MAG TPA: tetratricopeptide repeat protein [Chloroflexia bacterium]|nr:tetratricopeptide repeat protein [Chloroflexia bacterium]